jgi:hypothetical protein
VTQPVVDQERYAQPICLIDGEGEGVIVVRPQAALHPIEDVVTVGAGASLAARVDPEVVDHRG